MSDLQDKELNPWESQAARFDFAAKKVSLSSTPKGETRDKFCTGLTPSTLATTFLTDGKTEQKKP